MRKVWEWFEKPPGRLLTIAGLLLMVALVPKDQTTAGAGAASALLALLTEWRYMPTWCYLALALLLVLAGYSLAAYRRLPAPIETQVQEIVTAEPLGPIPARKTKSYSLSARRETILKYFRGHANDYADAATIAATINENTVDTLYELHYLVDADLLELSPSRKHYRLSPLGVACVVQTWGGGTG